MDLLPFLDYVARAASAWFLGFFPFVEIYVAVPTAFAFGLDPSSAVVWPVLGNVTPVRAQCARTIRSAETTATSAPAARINGILSP